MVYSVFEYESMARTAAEYLGWFAAAVTEYPGEYAEDLPFGCKFVNYVRDRIDDDVAAMNGLSLHDVEGSSLECRAVG